MNQRKIEIPNAVEYPPMEYAAQSMSRVPKTPYTAAINLQIGNEPQVVELDYFDRDALDDAVNQLHRNARRLSSIVLKASMTVINDPTLRDTSDRNITIFTKV